MEEKLVQLAAETLPDRTEQYLDGLITKGELLSFLIEKIYDTVSTIRNKEFAESEAIQLEDLS